MELLESLLKRHNYNPDRDLMKPLERFHRSNPLEQE